MPSGTRAAPAAATAQATSACRPTARGDLAPSPATPGQGTASDRPDGHAQRHEGGAERDYRAVTPAGHDAQPHAELIACPVPRFPAKAASTAAS